jgi:hypothetical protein
MEQEIMIMSDALVEDGIVTAAWIITSDECFKNESYLWGTGLFQKEIATHTGRNALEF